MGQPLQPMNRKTDGCVMKVKENSMTLKQKWNQDQKTKLPTPFLREKKPWRCASERIKLKRVMLEYTVIRWVPKLDALLRPVHPRTSVSRKNRRSLKENSGSKKESRCVLTLMQRQVKTARQIKCIATRQKVSALQKKLQVQRNQVVVVVVMRPQADAQHRALQQPPLLQFFRRKYSIF